MPGEVSLGDFMDVKGWKAVGNRLSDNLLSSVKEVLPKEQKPKAKAETSQSAQPSLFAEESQGADDQQTTDTPEETEDKKTYRAGDTIEFD